MTGGNWQLSARNIAETYERRDSHESANMESEVAAKTTQLIEAVQFCAGTIAVLARPVILAQARTRYTTRLDCGSV